MEKVHRLTIRKGNKFGAIFKFYFSVIAKWSKGSFYASRDLFLGRTVCIIDCKSE